MGRGLHFKDMIRPTGSPKVFNSHKTQLPPTPIQHSTPSHLTSLLFDNPTISPISNNPFTSPKKSHSNTKIPTKTNLHLSQLEFIKNPQPFSPTLYSTFTKFLLTNTLNSVSNIASGWCATNTIHRII